MPDRRLWGVRCCSSPFGGVPERMKVKGRQNCTTSQNVFSRLSPGPVVTGEGSKLPGQPEWTQPVRAGRSWCQGGVRTRAIGSSGSPGEARPARIQEENLLLQGGPGGAAPPRLVFACSVYSASGLRTRKQRARGPAQLAAWPWAAAAGLTALHTDAAPGGTEDSRRSHGAGR